VLAAAADRRHETLTGCSLSTPHREILFMDHTVRTTTTALPQQSKARHERRGETGRMGTCHPLSTILLSYSHLTIQHLLQRLRRDEEGFCPHCHLIHPFSTNDPTRVAGTFPCLVTNQQNTHNTTTACGFRTTRLCGNMKGQGAVYKIRPPFLSFLKFYFTPLYQI